MDNKEIAELATKVVEACAGTSNPHITWNVDGLCQLYEKVFVTIKKMDQAK